MPLHHPKVILLDRDGVINKDSPDFVKTKDEWQALPGSLEGIAELYKAGFILGIATNQSAVARGLITIDTLWGIHQKMLYEIQLAGGYVVKIFFCLHGPNDNCGCRKPKPGLLIQAAEQFACGFGNMIFIGDSKRDIEAARAVGARPVLVRTGNGRDTEKALQDASLEVHDDLRAAATALIAEHAA